MEELTFEDADVVVELGAWSFGGRREVEVGADGRRGERA